MKVNGVEYKVYTELPEGWIVESIGGTAPGGYNWINNGRPLWTKELSGTYKLNKEHECALLKI